MSDQHKYEIKNNTGKIHNSKNQLIQNHRAVNLPTNDLLTVLLAEIGLILLYLEILTFSL